MSQRHYFLSTKCSRPEGNGSYSYSWATASHTSRKADPIKVFNSMVDDAKDVYTKKGLDASSIEIVAFNKI